MEFGGSSPCYRRNISFLSQKSSQLLSLIKKNPSARSTSFVFYLWKIRKFFDSSSHLNLKFFRRLVHEEDQELIEIINNCVAQSFLYFSPEFDLTQNEQSRVHGKFASSTFSLHSFIILLRETDPRFLANKAFYSKELGAFPVSKVISGFIASSKIKIDQETLNLVIISKREIERQGTRFWVRGCDLVIQR